MLATVLFTDIVGSTGGPPSSATAPGASCSSVTTRSCAGELERFRGEEIDTAGDGFFATLRRARRGRSRCARAIRDGVRALGLEIRAGVHTGECERVDGKLAGIAVPIGARVAAQAEPGEVLVSRTVKDLVAGSGHRVRGPRRRTS